MIVYAVNRFTKEHRRADTIAWQCKYSMDWLIVEADADGWIAWSGGECPLPDDAWAEVKMRDRLTLKGRQARSAWLWKHYGCRNDIIAYRPILGDYTKPDAPERDVNLETWGGKGAMSGKGIRRTAENVLKVLRTHIDAHPDSYANFLGGEVVDMVKEATTTADKWDGEGLPPVGAQVGIIDDGTLHYGADECGPVIAHVEDTAVVRMSYGLGCFKADYLLPIRTDRERWIAAAEHTVENSTGEPANSTHLGLLFDAGLARLPEE